MGKTFRSPRANNREHLAEEKKPSKKRTEKDRPERSERQQQRTDKPEKKTLQEASADLKRNALEKVRELKERAKKVEADADFEQLMIQMYGPQIDPRVPLLQFEGQRIPKPTFDDLLMQTFRKQSNRLPVTWENEKDYRAECIKNKWVEIDDNSVYILPLSADLSKVEAA